MTGVGEQDLAVGRVYSSAMLELAEAQGDVDVLLWELADFTDHLAEQEEFRAFVSNPTIDMEARQESLEKLFRGRYSDLFVDSLQVLNHKGRLSYVTAVAEAYRRECEKLKGRIRVYVQSAWPLTDSLRERLSASIAKLTGKEPDLVETMDESLIGGLVVRIGDEKMDGSVATKLKRLGRALRDRASHEIHGGRPYWDGAAW